MDTINVAIADANTLLREGLKRILSAEGDFLVVGEAASGAESSELLERNTPDVLLLDLNLPRRGAVPVLLEIDQKRLHTRPFILSMLSERETILDTAKMGACGYALKRLSSATIIEAIRRIHLGEIWVDKQLKCEDAFVELARQKQTQSTARTDSGFKALSKREFEILRLVAKGETNQQISDKLFISLDTVKVHLYHVFTKLQVNNRTQAALLLIHSYRREPAAGLRTEAREHHEIGNRRVATAAALGKPEKYESP